PTLEATLDGERQHRDPRRDRGRVERPHPAGADLLGGLPRTLERAGELRREVQREDALVAGELLVRREEVARRGLRGRGRVGRPAEPAVELLRPQLLVVAVAPVAEADVERHDPPVRELLRAPGVVGRRVEDDRRVARVQRAHDAAAARIAWTMASSGSSFRMQVTAPASSIASISRLPAAAVSATTATSGHSSRISSVTWTPSSPGRR